MADSKEILHTRVSEIYLKDDIYRVIIKDDAHVMLPDAEEIIATILKINGGTLLPVFIDIRKIKMISWEARKYFASDDRPRVGTVVAIIVGSSTTRVIGNFFLGLNKPSYPLRIFSSEIDAVNWLKGHSK